MDALHLGLTLFQVVFAVGVFVYVTAPLLLVAARLFMVMRDSRTA